MAHRLVAAGILAGGLVLTIAVQPAAACSFAPATLEQVVVGTDLIFVAQVSEQPADRTYVLEVTEVFRGAVPASVTFAPDSGAAISSCEADVKVGSTYLFGMNDLTGALDLSDVWLRINGEKLIGVRITPPPGGTSAMYDVLRDLPDTAMRNPPSDTPPSPSPMFLGVLLLVAALALSARTRLNRNYRP